MLKQLLEYQEVDIRLLAIEDALKKSDEYKKYAQATKFLKTVDENRTLFENRSGALLHAYNEKMKEFDALIEGKAEFDESIDENADEKEVAFFNRRLQETVKQISTLESEIKQLQANVNDLIAQYNTFVKKTKLAIGQRNEYKEKYNALVKEKEQEKTAIEAERQKIGKNIPAEILQKYNEKRKDSKTKVLCEAVNGFCTSCGTELVLAEKEKLKANGIIECATCHKLIYTK